jgi:hypothetical protein
MRLHTLLYLHALGFVCFLFVEAERAMAGTLRPGQLVPGKRTPSTPRELAWSTAMKAVVYLMCCVATSAYTAASEVSLPRFALSLLGK